VGDSVTFTAAIAGNWKLTLYWRPVGGNSPAYREKPMSGSGGNYMTSLRITEEMKNGVDYTIAATDGTTTVRAGSPIRPLKLQINPAP
jgi:hypothetical protein